jgi:hypothetical protein
MRLSWLTPLWFSEDADGKAGETTPRQHGSEANGAGRPLRGRQPRLGRGETEENRFQRSTATHLYVAAAHVLILIDADAEAVIEFDLWR